MSNALVFVSWFKLRCLELLTPSLIRNLLVFIPFQLLRQHVRNQTDLGKEAKKHMDAGHLVPDDLMITLVLQDAMDDVHAKGHLLLDGFPRTIQQAVALDRALNVDLVINLDIPTETIVERISDR